MRKTDHRCGQIAEAVQSTSPAFDAECDFGTEFGAHSKPKGLSMPNMVSMLNMTLDTGYDFASTPTY